MMAFFRSFSCTSSYWVVERASQFRLISCTRWNTDYDRYFEDFSIRLVVRTLPWQSSQWGFAIKYDHCFLAIPYNEWPTVRLWHPTSRTIDLSKRNAAKATISSACGIKEIIEETRRKASDSKEYRDAAGVLYSRYLCSNANVSPYFGWVPMDVKGLQWLATARMLPSKKIL